MGAFKQTFSKAKGTVDDRKFESKWIIIMIVVYIFLSSEFGNIWPGFDKSYLWYHKFCKSPVVLHDFWLWQGFGEADVEAAPKKKEKKTPLNDDVENSAPPADDGEILPDMSDDENDENIRDSQRE